ncbi:HNH endonuclease signature motif containing protein [Cupriavidus basilensis]
MVHRGHGGSDVLGNRVLLHPDCHVQAHNCGLTVMKPDPSEEGSL